MRARFVDTPERRAERNAGRVLYRNSFGTQRSGGALANVGDVQQRNVSNTNLLLVGDRLLSLWEALQPYELDPATLRTRGLSTLDGALRLGLPFATGVAPLDQALADLGTGLGGDAFSAHPHVCGESGAVVTFSYTIRLSAGPAGPLQTVLRMLEFPAGSLKPGLPSREVPLIGYGFVHDFAFTKSFSLLFQSPVDIDLVPFVSGQRCPGQCLSFKKERPTHVHIVPRGRESEPIRVAQLPASFVFHHANAFETTDSAGAVTLHCDSVHMPGLYLGPTDEDFREADFSLSPPYQLWRSTISFDPASDAPPVASMRLLSPRIVEFPTVDPRRFGRRARFVYAATTSHESRVQPLQCWLKFDLDSEGAERGEAAFAIWRPGARDFVGEPCFVPRPGGREEDDGWLVGWLFEAALGVSSFAVIDARSMVELARVRLRHHVPYGLHGTWVDGRVFAEHIEDHAM